MNNDALVAEFWARVDVRGPTDCWEWIGTRYERGYGALSVFGKSWR